MDAATAMIRPLGFLLIQGSLVFTAAQYVQPRREPYHKIKCLGLCLLVALLGLLPRRWFALAVLAAIVADLFVLYACFVGPMRTMLFVTAICSAIGFISLILAGKLANMVYPGSPRGIALPRIVLRFLIFAAMDILLTDIFVIIRRRNCVTLRKRGHYVFIACWCLELLTLSLFALHTLGTPIGITRGTVFGIALSLGSYFLLTGLYSGYMRRCIVREERREAIAAELAIEERQFAAVSSELTDLRRLRHDYRNHMAVIEAMVRDGKRSEALHYLEDFQHQLESAGQAQTVELRDYGRVTAEMAQKLASEGISVAFTGQPPVEGEEGHAFLTQLEIIVDQAARMLRNCQMAKIRLHLDAPRVTLRLEPITAKNAQELASSIRDAVAGAVIENVLGNAAQYSISVTLENCLAYYKDIEARSEE